MAINSYGTENKPVGDEEQIIQDIEQWGGNPPLNIYLLKRAKKELAELNVRSLVVEPKKKVKPTANDLKAKPMYMLKSMAKGLGLKGYTKFKEDELIKLIMKNMR